MKLALVVDKSEAYLNFQRERILASWKTTRQQGQEITSLGEGGGFTLFGEAPVSLMHLQEQAAMVKTLQEAEALTPEEVARLGESGLLITCNLPRTQTKKFEATWKNLGAQVYLPPTGKEEGIAARLVGELGLTPAVKDFLLSYVGENYDTLLPLVDSLSALPKAKHRFITEEDIYIRLPQPPGAVAPWAIEKPLFAGNMSEVIDIFRRTHHHSSLLVILATLKNKLQLAYRVAGLLTFTPRMSEEATASLLGVTKNYGHTLAHRHASKYGVKVLEEAVLLLRETEDKVKGASSASSVVEMEALLVRLCYLFQGK